MSNQLMSDSMSLCYMGNYEYATWETHFNQWIHGGVTVECKPLSFSIVKNFTNHLYKLFRGGGKIKMIPTNAITVKWFASSTLSVPVK